MSLPLVELAGDPREQGLAHGRALAGEIAHNLDVYFDRFERDALLKRSAVLDMSLRYLTALCGRDGCADYIRGMEGIAEGAGLPFEEIVALNLRYELLYYQYGRKELPGGDGPGDGCTSFALLPEATGSGHLIIGQNWDWIPQVRCALLRTVEAEGTRILAFTEAGIFGGKIGMSSRGIGLAINGMTSTGDDWSRFATPFHFRCRDILRAETFDEAVAAVEREPRACTANFLIAGRPDDVLDLEAAPDTVVHQRCDGGGLVHANHFVDPAAAGLVEPPHKGRVHSRHRARRLAEILRTGRPLTLAALQDKLRDHDGRPNSVCRHEDTDLPPAERIITVASIIMDLQAGVMWASDGPPCENVYGEYAL